MTVGTCTMWEERRVGDSGEERGAGAAPYEHIHFDYFVLWQAFYHVQVVPS